MSWDQLGMSCCMPYSACRFEGILQEKKYFVKCVDSDTSVAYIHFTNQDGEGKVKSYRIWYNYMNRNDEECLDFFVVNATSSSEAEIEGRAGCTHGMIFFRVENI